MGQGGRKGGTEGGKERKRSNEAANIVSDKKDREDRKINGETERNEARKDVRRETWKKDGEKE